MPATVYHALSMDDERKRLLQNERNRASYQRHLEARRAKSREYQRKRHAENYPHVKALAQKWNAENKDRVEEMRKARRPAYKEKERAYSRKWIAENKEKTRAYYEANREKWREQYRKWSRENPDKESARAALRRARVLMATPKWANLDAIEQFYVMAYRSSIETGVKHHVDHVIPLKGKLVCGLHCEANLQVITAFENMSKGNKCQ